MSLTVAFTKGDAAFHASSSKVSLEVVEASPVRFKCPSSGAQSGIQSGTRREINPREFFVVVDKYKGFDDRDHTAPQVQRESFLGWEVAAKGERSEIMFLDVFLGERLEHRIC